jgi:glycosyltransferase involved in cell wall biosynthesis
VEQKKKSIVFINQATGYLTIDIINAFATSDKIEEVALIAGSIRVQDVNLHEKVKWSKIALYNRGNPAKKFLSWFYGTLQIFFLLLTRYRKYEIFYITIPPFAYLLSLVLRNKFSVLVFDVYPDVLKIYNISEGNWIYKFWIKANKNLFKRAHRVYTIGNGMANLLAKYVNREKLTIIHNWSGLTKVKEILRDENHFIKAQGLEQKFIVQYSGNIGYTHNVEVLVEIAKALQSEEDIFVLIIGRGERYNHIQELVSKSNLKNCRLLPFQPDDQLNYTLSAADLGVVLLDDKTAHVSIPSKIYNLQAVGVPILGIAIPDSELGHHLEKHANGICFSPSDIKSIVDFIKEYRSKTPLQK